MKQIKISKLGNRLPFGLSYENQTYKTFTLKPWTLKEEKALAKLDNEAPNLGKYIGRIVSALLDSLDSLNFSELSQNKKDLIITQMYAADVFAIYVTARIQNIGEKMMLPFRCFACNRDFRFEADLETLDILTFEKEDPATYTFDFPLKKDIEVEKKKYKKLKCRLAKFETFYALAQGQDLTSYDFRLALFQNCIVGLEGFQASHYTATEGDLETLGKIDFESLAEKLFFDSMGVEFEIQSQCPTCKKKIRDFVLWSPDSFFAVRSGRKER